MAFLAQNNGSKELLNAQIKLGIIKIHQKKYTEAISIGNATLKIAVKYRFLEAKSDIYDLLNKAYEKQGNPDMAYRYFKMFVSLQDSLNKQNTGVIKQQLQYEFGKKEDSLKQQQIITNAKLQQQILLAKQQQQTLQLQQASLDLTNKEKELQRLDYLKTQAELQVEQNGGQIVSGVSSKLHYLVVGEDAGSKLEKAKKINTINIISEDEFLELISSQ